ncbi:MULTISPECIES: hypothetical protein [unclassified Nocardiopsis]|uniref:hypothetical protein n=1 Tax=Nocardiopsis TaxID=2013 RepID=UPI00387AAA74
MDWTTTISYTGVHDLDTETSDRLSTTATTTVYDANTGRLTITVHGVVTVEDAHEILETADIRSDTVDVVEVRSTRTDEAEYQKMHPTPLTLATITDAAEILGDISRQRADALLKPTSPKRDPNAPDPLAITRNGPVWERSAIELYALRRDPTMDPWKHRR